MGKRKRDESVDANERPTKEAKHNFVFFAKFNANQVSELRRTIELLANMKEGHAVFCCSLDCFGFVVDESESGTLARLVRSKNSVSAFLCCAQITASVDLWPLVGFLVDSGEDLLPIEWVIPRSSMSEDASQEAIYVHHGSEEYLTVPLLPTVCPSPFQLPPTDLRNHVTISLRCKHLRELLGFYRTPDRSSTYLPVVIIDLEKHNMSVYGVGSSWHYNHSDEDIQVAAGIFSRLWLVFPHYKAIWEASKIWYDFQLILPVLAEEKVVMQFGTESSTGRLLISQAIGGRSVYQR